jgi:hypothetical protein
MKLSAQFYTEAYGTHGSRANSPAQLKIEKWQLYLID